MDYKELCQQDITLRDYQQKAKEEIFSRWSIVDNILYQMPTGTGKTRLFTSIIRDISLWGLRHSIFVRILIIAHRSELIEQSSNSLSRYRIDHGVLAGTLKEMRDLRKPIQVASIQTITHPANRRLIEDLKFDFIIIDEAHHAIARSYKLLWRFCPDAKKLGVTASPWRMNNCGFSGLFDAYIPSMNIKEFIKQGWLASYLYYSIPIDSKVIRTINAIREYDVEGDFRQKALIDVIDTSKIRAQLFDSYAKIAFGKKGIIYSISRSHSEHICEQFRCHNVKIENIDSNTPTELRNAVIQAFRNGDIDIIVNVDIFSEGFDCPDIEFIQLARPTKSLVKYIQQVGRGLRKNGSKQCLILDNVGMYSRFGLPDEERDWESYFYGRECDAKLQSSGIRQEQDTHEGVEVDISEGNEEMILIQDTFNAALSLSTTETSERRIEDILSEKVGHTIIDNCIVSSKPFCSGKYIIEEHQNGFYIVNVRSQKRMLLVKVNTFLGGVIIVNKESDRNTFTIIKALSLSSLDFSSSKIIGTLYKEGLILKFTAFDKSVLNIRIMV